RGFQNVVDHVGHGIAETAGRIHGDQDERGLPVSGIGEAFIDVGGEDWFDFAIELQFENKGRVLCPGFRGVQETEAEEKQGSADTKRTKESSNSKTAATSVHCLPPVGLFFSR